MNYTEHKFTLDVSKTVSQVSLSVKKGDTARRLLISLMKNGYPYYISSDCYAVIAATKPDGHVIFNNCSIENNVIGYDFTPQTVAAVGLVNCEVIVYGARGLQLTSASFDIIVEDSNYSAVESSSEATAFGTLLLEIKALNTIGLRAPAIICEAKGENISLADASNEALQGLRIFGKSIQDGKPTPENPVEIVDLAAPVVTLTDGTNVQTMAIADSLPGMRVTSGGNYTDADGQQWTGDEIDLGRGVYVQRVNELDAAAFNSAGYVELGEYARLGLWIPDGKYNSISTANGLCNILPFLGNYSADQLHFYAMNQQIWVFVPISELDERTTEGVLMWLRSKGAKFQYILNTPIERPMDSTQKDAFAQLHTYKPYTNIYNDVGAYMAADYVADTKTYIRKNGGGASGSAVTLGTVTLLANKWVGNADPYSQVVTIAGVTEYSQVDLKPSVEQLAIFHDKDLAFVTENDGGVVTVYAIGDKPTNDYTIQVNITEVNV